MHLSCIPHERFLEEKSFVSIAFSYHNFVSDIIDLLHIELKLILRTLDISAPACGHTMSNELNADENQAFSAT